jgi:hypothetical protein
MEGGHIDNNKNIFICLKVPNTYLKTYKISKSNEIYISVSKNGDCVNEILIASPTMGKSVNTGLE